MSHSPLYIAFIWHMHQPLYKDAASSHHYMMPWVRLHGVKDYLDMVSVLNDYPNLHQTFNLVPSLLEQIQDYASGNAQDHYMVLSQKPVSSLNHVEKTAILHTFFDLNWDQMVAPYPRYRELGEQRNFYHRDGHYDRAIAAFKEEDWLDLTTWFNLAWIDPHLRKQYPVLRQLTHKGRGFTHEERQQVLQHHQQIIQEIIPTYRHFLSRGQIDMTTSPYYHPILPLLYDTNAGAQPTPGLPLPHNRYRAEADVTAHLQQAMQSHQAHFGQLPRGLWPSEQSLSPAVLPLIAQQGLQWMASSEGILWHSLGVVPHRNAQHIWNLSEYLYRPYRIQTPAGPLQMVFRDLRLSDLIGFHYWRGDNEHNARHMYQQIKNVQQDLATKEPYPYLLTIALDGENCWEFYQDDGHHFLHTLYGLLNQDTSLSCVTVSEYLERFPAVTELPRLHPGSWIQSDFTTWIGEPTKNLAWELLGQTRAYLVTVEADLTPEQRQAAWQEIYIAEGSDWFWWFGEGHSSAHDHLFDEAFRVHLMNVYRLLDADIPAALHIPLAQQQRADVNKSGPAEGPSATMQAGYVGD